jgi:uncharacterized protein (TIGR03085 family)
MAAPSLDQRERQELCDLFLAVGPAAPTLCEGWATLDLAAHLVIREGDPRSAPGIMLGGRFAAYTAKLQEKAKARGFEHLVAKIRSGPPLPVRAIPPLRRALSLSEYFVHHEDVRRANGQSRRTDRPDLDAALWKQLSRMARFMTRSVDPYGLDLVWPNRDPSQAPAQTARAHKGSPVVQLSGPPSELQLYLTGRKSAAEIELTGPPDAVVAVGAAKFGI